MIISPYYLFEEYHFAVPRKNDISFTKGAVFTLWRIRSHLTGCINWTKIYFILTSYLRFAVSLVPNCIMIREEKENQYNY